jgi:acyl-coenzyme A synthetase/AMP-(fatty) acid ligase
MAKNPYRLIPNILDQHAQDDPDKLYAELPVSHTDFTSGFRPITYGALANAVNGAAWWLTENLGPADYNFPTLAYIGPNDLCHTLLLLGAVKAGYKMLFTSPRYSIEAQVKLMKAVDCKAILTSSIITPMSEIVEQIAERHGGIQVHHVPMTTFFLDGKYGPFPYDKSFEEARDEPLVVLHTSGTTGFPKPVIWTHDWAASFALQRYLEPPEGYESFDRLILGTRVFSLFPQFHAGSLFICILFTIYSDTILIMPPALAAPTAELAVAASQHTKVDAFTLVPPQIEQLGANPALVDTIVKNGVNAIFWAGGPVSQHHAVTIASRITLFNTSGSTEMGMWPVIRKSGPWDVSICRDMRFHPQNNIDFREQSEGIYSAIVVKNNPEVGVQPVFHYVKEVTEYDTGDLYTPVSGPEKDHHQLWRYYGRSDDMQVFESGLKWHPSVAERRIVSENSGIVQEALLDGTRRAHIVLLLELVPSIAAQLSAMSEREAVDKKEQILDDVWPIIAEINLSTPSWVKIDRKRVVFCEAGKPLARTAKGTIQRRQAVTIYESQIQDLF